MVQQQDGVWVHHCPRRQRGGEGRQRRVCAPLHNQGCAGAVPVPCARGIRGVRAFQNRRCVKQARVSGSGRKRSQGRQADLRDALGEQNDERRRRFVRAPIQARLRFRRRMEDS